MDQESRKKGFLITDFMARKKSKEMHLKHPKVISAQALYDKEYKALNTKKTELAEMEILKGKIAMRRLEMEGERDGSFVNPRTKDEIKVAYDWATCTEQISSITEVIDKQDKKMTMCEVELKKETELAKKLQSDVDERDTEMSILRKNVFRIKSNHSNEAGAISKEDDNNTSGTTSEKITGKESNKVKMKDDSPFISSTVGLVAISKISQDGLKLSGHLHLPPSIKFYSGLIFKADNKKMNYVVRDKSTKINCITGFTDQTSGEKYHLTSVMDGKVKALSLRNEVITVERFKMNDMPFKLEWIIRDGDSVSSLSSVNHTYGLPVMPSDRSRIRKSQLLENKYVPVQDDKRKRKKATKRKDKNEVYTRYKKSRVSNDDLIKKALAEEPMYASCLEVTEDGKQVFDSCCNKMMTPVYQNMMKHIKTKKYKIKYDEKKNKEIC